MPKLRDHIAVWLGDWQHGLSDGWLRAIGPANPDYRAIRCASTIEPPHFVYPRRRLDAAHPENVPDRSHIYRALNELPPDRVAVVFVGQDPYTVPARATGRAFEAGGQSEWQRVGRITSLRRICQQLAAYSTGNLRYQQVDNWQLLKRNIADGRVQMPTVPETFDNWQNAGVLLLNQSLTATTRPAGMIGDHPHLRDHLKLWRPIVRRICQHLAQENDIVFVLLSGKAQRFFDAIPGLPSEVRTVRRCHPAYIERETRRCPFLEGPNLFQEIDGLLEELGRNPVPW